MRSRKSEPTTPEAGGTSKKTNRQRIYDAKRARGEISCAECRRLKLKCDKKIPCNTCVKRGCANICPNGKLSTGQGTRLILADTDALHRKITQLSERVRQLEDALGIMQAAVSQERHPLLRDELLKVKFWPEVTQDDEAQPQAESPGVADTALELGTLSIGENGDAKYFGRSAGAESLLHSHDPADELTLPPELGDFPALVATFDAWNSDARQVLQALEASLPPITRAWSLCEAYYEYSAFFRPVKRDEFVDHFMTPLYAALRENAEPGSIAERMPHKLAVVYLLFAMGALMDLTQPPYNKEAWRYAVLGKNALLMKSVKDSPAIETVQAMALLAHFFSQSGRRNTVEYSWAIISNCLRLAQSIGLHRDCARWGLEEKHIQRRRYVFWEVYKCGVHLSLQVGRPPTIAAAFIDCEYPTDDEQTTDSQGKVEPGFWQWQYSVVKDYMAPILEDAIAVKPSSYEFVLEFDRKIRQMTVPESVSFVPSSEQDGYERPAIWFKVCRVMQCRLSPLLFVHRPFFAKALMDYGNDPMRSPYAPSYLASYRCAVLLIKSHVQYFQRCPDLFLRLGGFWTYVFTAAVVLGLIVTRSPGSTTATNALALLDLALDLFEKGAVVNARAQRAITFLRALKGKAHKADSDARQGTDVQRPNSPPASDGPDELALFGGQTKLLNTKVLTKYWAQGVRLKSSSNGRPISDGRFERLSDGHTTSEGDTGITSQLDAYGQTAHALYYGQSYLDAPRPGEDPVSAMNDSLAFWNGQAFQAQFLEFPQDMSFLDSCSSPMDGVQQPDHVASSDLAATVYSQMQGNGTPTPSQVQGDTVNGEQAGSLAVHALLGQIPPQAERVDMDMDEQWIDMMRGAGLLDMYDVQQ